MSAARLNEAGMSGARMMWAVLSNARLNGADLKGANLSWARLDYADLSGASLIGAVLDKASLIGATLDDADLSETYLFGADFSRARLINATLDDVDLEGANFRGADLHEATLIRANLNDADFSEADLTGANLTEARMTETKLANAVMRFAILDFAVFHPASVPLGKDIVGAKDLETLRFERPHAMVQLREAFKVGGFRQEERLITCMIKRNEQMKAGFVEETLLFILFDLTCAYGASPARPLKILAVLIPVFAMLYFFGLRAKGDGGIWKVWPEDRVRKDIGDEDEPERLTPTNHLGDSWLVLFFSLLSAFHVGWRELNVGNWLLRIHRGEYTLRATGWVKSVSGVQSLISVYLLALSVLTYFGRPFD